MSTSCSLGLLLLVVVGQAVPIQVTTPNGILQGVGDDTGTFAAFKGIPYAEPPKRWTNPIAKASWAPNVLLATGFGAACMQGEADVAHHSPKLAIDENCLFANVWAPFAAASDPTSFSLPVMVFIHGGGFVSGTGADPDFWGDNLVNRTEVVLVTFNYRLGVWGFLAGSSSTAPRGNFGIKDQQMLLTWVQANIASFGGDPTRVTVFGQSAGGMSVGLHLVMPSSFGLYKQAIAESNPAGLIFRTLADDQTYFEAFVKDTLCGDPNNSAVMGCLRSRSAQWLLKVQTMPEYAWTMHLPIRSIEGLVWEPVIDGVLLPDNPPTLIANGKHNTNAKVIFGTVRNETNGFFGGALSALTPIEYELFLEAIFAKNTSTILAQYPATVGAKSNSLGQLNAVLTDYLFICPVRSAARYYQQYAASANSVFVYNFLYTPTSDPENPGSACDNAACHSIELEYVFDSRSLIPGNMSFSVAEQQLSDAISALWTSFAATGAPSYQTGGGSNLDWPTFDGSSDVTLALDVVSNGGVRPISGFDQTNCDFWDSIGYIY